MVLKNKQFFCSFNSYNSLLLFMLCESFLLLSQVSVESKGSCMIQSSILFLCFSKVFPKVGSKRFKCRILQGCDSQANVYFTHTSRFGLTFCTFPYCLCLKLINIQFHCLKEDFFFLKLLHCFYVFTSCTNASFPFLQ